MITHLLVAVLFALQALNAGQGGYNAFIIVVDRQTNKPLSAEVWLGEHVTQTVAGKATFMGISKGRYRLAVIPDEDRYPAGNGTISVPQYETIILRLERRP